MYKFVIMFNMGCVLQTVYEIIPRIKIVQNLRSIVMSPSMDPSEATDIIVREKKIKTISSNDQ
jgi:hypothetical protein